MIKPIVLDFDNSVQTLNDEIRFDLKSWQEQIRFGCSKQAFKAFTRDILLPKLDRCENHSKEIIFLGSGDFHHLSLPLIERQSQIQSQQTQNDLASLQLIILDNHPDNMRYLFGIHCGSWVSFAAKLPYISHIHVVGITSSDIAFSHLYENRLAPLYSGKITYWCKGIETKWVDRIGLKKAYRTFGSLEDLIATFIEEQKDQHDPIYLSIDKDVLSENVIQTNWDQGDLSKTDFFDLLTALKPRILSADVTGDISVYQYANRFKRWLSQLDAQPQFEDAALIKAWQNEQHQLNQEIIALLSD